MHIHINIYTYACIYVYFTLYICICIYIYILINQQDIFFKSVIFQFIRIFNGLLQTKSGSRMINRIIIIIRVIRINRIIIIIDRIIIL